MKKLTETMKQMLDALACAHAGEYLSAREKARVLAHKPDAINTQPAGTEPVEGCAEPASQFLRVFHLSTPLVQMGSSGHHPVRVGIS